MKKLLLAASLLFALAPAAGTAQSVFDGTWKTDPSKVTFPTKPTVLSLKDGMYECKSCTYKTHVKADGTDQKIEGNPYTDTMAVKVIDKRTVESVSKKGGKQNGWSKRVVAADGNSMTVEYKSNSPVNGEVVSGKTSFKRVDKDPPGANLVSGSWLPTKVDSRTDNGMIVTYKTVGNVVNMSAPTGESFSAKTDGSDAPMKGDPGVTTVAVKIVGKNVLEEVDKLNGKVVGSSKTTVDASGKTAKVEWEDKLAGTSGSYVMMKQ
ncbi:MAG: hypothetical protein ABI790_10775 [Betaproteobacteria bacterium]